MTTSLAIIGKSGSGKTTITKAFLRIFQEYFPDKSILLFDNDLAAELGHSFGKDIRNTIYGIRSGKHEYKTGIPEDMSKQEYIEWALEDIVVSLEENVDIIVSWFVASKDCRCPITKQMNEAVSKFINQYDFVIFDCEFDLKYLNQLVDIDINTAIIVTNPTEESFQLVKRIEEFSAKYSAGGQLGVVLNKVNNEDMTTLFDKLKKYELEVLGVVPDDKELHEHSIERESLVVQDAIKQFYFRLNLPQKRI